MYTIFKAGTLCTSYKIAPFVFVHQLQDSTRNLGILPDKTNYVDKSIAKCAILVVSLDKAKTVEQTNAKHSARNTRSCRACAGSAYLQRSLQADLYEDLPKA